MEPPRTLPVIDAADAHELGLVRSDAELLASLGPQLARLHRVAQGLCASRADADDLVADSVLEMLPRWRNGQIADPAAYLRRTLVNRATRRWRRLAVAARRDHAAREWTPAAADAPGQSDERSRVLDALRVLPARQRAIVVLRYYEDRPLDEIAALLGIAVGTVKSQLARANVRLSVALGEQE